MENEWAQAVALLVRHGAGKAHLDDLLEHAGVGRLRWLVMEVFRDWLRIERILAPRLARQPGPAAAALLRLAVAELLNRGTEAQAQVVHHAVETARHLKLSRPEAGFVNAVLRAVLRAGLETGEDALAASHPEWLVARWERQYGAEATQALLAWNQSVPRLTVRAPACPAYAEPTAWPGYFALRKGGMAEARADLAAGRVYMQDPFARVPVELLAVRPRETVFDLCAAPGGKSRLLADALGGTGRLVAVDKPGRRLQRLHDNLAGHAESAVRVVGCRIQDLAGALEPEGLRPGSAAAVLIDVPCSNTGVIQKRPDVKLRLREGDIARQAAGQLALLQAAAVWVRAGGRLVYSTCSLEEEENAGVVQAFLAATPGWRLETAITSLPWECGHDGGGAFLLTQVKGG